MTRRSLLAVLVTVFLVTMGHVASAGFVAERKTLATSATLIYTYTPGTGYLEFAVQNISAVTVYLGGSSGVTTSTGLPLAAGASVSWWLEPGSTVYGIVASGTADVAVLRNGQ